MAKILVVEDDPDLLAKVKDWLTFEKHTVETVANGRDALESLKFYKYDLVVLDWMIPEVAGIEVLKRYRAEGGTIPILMLTGKREVSEREAGLDGGADDYLTKPFDARELSARIRALLRRAGAGRFVENVIAIKHLKLDTAAHKVTIDGKELQLQPLEYSLLEFLMRHPNQAYSQEALLNHVWGSSSDATVDTLRTYVKTLRRKIDKDGEQSLIRTIHGVGYRLEA